MQKRIVLLGSTGSIGTQTLEVVLNLRESHSVEIIGMSAHSNVELLRKQADEFGLPQERICLSSKEPDKLLELAALPNCIVVNAIVGSAGLESTLAALKAGNTVALANKESLVAGGERVMQIARDNNAKLIPVDSEHSAIWQCIGENRHKDIAKIILTASGGPFFGYSKEQLKTVTKEQTLNHPNWSMGAKISVDSATLMNKGLELIEAMYLFGLPEDKIDVVIHPQSIIHSAVEFVDGSVIAQMSVPDMRLPIQYALTYPERLPSPLTQNEHKKLSLTELGSLTFAKPDYKVFSCLALAREAARHGGDAPRRLNQANEEAVELFLKSKINFCEIAEYITESIKS
ncbi:MAG: 1-deoxy-D-xylulose-5-phosphate reductoisomerase [Oscillospiraceae bacterium]|nr:1-deoxy-D-xylulose-5-phosphate reductoisomerase [Oscillospiraceae bacterium]